MGTPALTVKVKIKSKLKFYVLRLLLISFYLTLHSSYLLHGILLIELIIV